MAPASLDPVMVPEVRRIMLVQHPRALRLISGSVCILGYAAARLGSKLICTYTYAHMHAYHGPMPEAGAVYRRTRASGRGSARRRSARRPSGRDSGWPDEFISSLGLA